MSGIVSLFENYTIESRASLYIDELNFPNATELHLFKNARIEIDSYICIEKINVPVECVRYYLREAKFHPWATVKIEGHFLVGNYETEKLFFYNDPAIRSKSNLTPEQFVKGEAIKAGTELVIDEIILKDTQMTLELFNKCPFKDCPNIIAPCMKMRPKDVDLIQYITAPYHRLNFCYIHNICNGCKKQTSWANQLCADCEVD